MNSSHITYVPVLLNTTSDKGATWDKHCTFKFISVLFASDKKKAQRGHLWEHILPLV